MFSWLLLLFIGWKICSFQLWPAYWQLMLGKSSWHHLQQNKKIMFIKVSKMCLHNLFCTSCVGGATVDGFFAPINQPYSTPKQIPIVVMTPYLLCLVITVWFYIKLYQMKIYEEQQQVTECVKNEINKWWKVEIIEIKSLVLLIELFPKIMSRIFLWAMIYKRRKEKVISWFLVVENMKCQVVML